jgi:hypothetical protein
MCALLVSLDRRNLSATYRIYMRYKIRSLAHRGASSRDDPEGCTADEICDKLKALMVSRDPPRHAMLALAPLKHER